MSKQYQEKTCTNNLIPSLTYAGFGLGGIFAGLYPSINACTGKLQDTAFFLPLGSIVMVSMLTLAAALAATSVKWDKTHIYYRSSRWEQIVAPKSALKAYGHTDITGLGYAEFHGYPTLYFDHKIRGSRSLKSMLAGNIGKSTPHSEGLTVTQMLFDCLSPISRPVKATLLTLQNVATSVKWPVNLKLKPAFDK